MQVRRATTLVALACLVAVTAALAPDPRALPAVTRTLTALPTVTLQPVLASNATPKPRTHARRTRAALAVTLPRNGIALTFDDGPDPTWTPRVLALLARHHVHATFCMIGREAAAHPEVVRAVVAAGHALCDHTWAHDERLGTRSPARIRADIARAYAAIVAASGGTRPVFFRAPGGNWTPALLDGVRASGLVALRWTVDPRDWSRPGAGAIRLTTLAQSRPHGVVLLHDGGGDRSQTLVALAQLLTDLARRGYVFVIPSTS